MNIDWTARGTTVQDSLRERVDQYLAKLERVLRGPTEASVIVSQDGDPKGTALHSFEVIVRNRLGTFTAREESRDAGEAVNIALSRLDAQVHKAHDKMLAGRRRNKDDSWSPEPVGGE